MHAKGRETLAGIATFDEAMAAIHDRSGYDRGFISDPFAGDAAARRGLRRTRAVLDVLGKPDGSYPIVHVAGSKGKGSTCVFVDAILRAAGNRTGRFLSPHLHSWRERFVVDDRLIAKPAFVALARDALTAAEKVEATSPDLGEVTAFELATAMALLHFQRSACDIAVVEVGLGGTLDATNVVDPAVSVIAPLDYEHTAILGATMTEIAGNKAGIIKPGRPVVSAAQPPDGMPVIERRADACGSPLLVAGRDWTVAGTDRDFTASGPWGIDAGLQVALAGQHQVDNAGLAIAAVHALGRHDPAAIRTGLRSATLPGRFEVVRRSDATVVVIDGAHSPAATTALAATLRERYPCAGVTIVAGLLRDKSSEAVLTPLLDIAERWIAVTPESPRALAGADVVVALRSLGANATTSPTIETGLGDAADAPLTLVTGSLTTAAEARVALGLPGAEAAPGRY